MQIPLTMSRWGRNRIARRHRAENDERQTKILLWFSIPKGWLGSEPEVVSQREKRKVERNHWRRSQHVQIHSVWRRWFWGSDREPEESGEEVFQFAAAPRQELWP